MKAVVVYESTYENTHRIAEAVAEGAGEAADVTLCRVADATHDVVAAADLVVVGGPTHMHGLSSDRSRKLGAEAGVKKGVALDPAAEGPGVRAWFEQLPRAAGAKGAAFDTRLPGRPLLTGSAAKAIGRRLRRYGYELVAGPESFLVETGEGPLADGELERARAWGASLVTPD